MKRAICQKPGGARRAGNNPEGGFVLVGALLIMLILVLIGISATTSTNLELQIAGVERAHTETFFQGEAGLETATLLLEENIACSGFTLPGETGTNDFLVGPLRVFDATRSFWENTPLSPNPAWNNPAADWGLVLAFLNADPDDDTDPAQWADFVMADLFPGTAWNPRRGTSVMLGGETRLAVGGAMQMAAGYVGVGKGVAAGGGAALVYDIYVQHRGARNTSKLTEIRWRHSVGQEGTCREADL